MKAAKIGDKVTAHGQTYEIAKIFYQEYWESHDLWNIEFLDPNGGYHHWKQSYDGGYLIEKRTVWVVTKGWIPDEEPETYEKWDGFQEIVGVYDDEEKARAVQEELLNSQSIYDDPVDVCIEEHTVQ